MTATPNTLNTLMQWILDEKKKENSPLTPIKKLMYIVMQCLLYAYFFFLKQLKLDFFLGRSYVTFGGETVEPTACIYEIV